MKTKYEKSVHPSGITVLCEHLPAMNTVSVGCWFATGSRYETESVQGSFHFIEHMLFKGTRRRSVRDIAIEVENVGAQLNALTGKELTCYYSKALSEDLPLMLDVLTDMVFCSTFDREEFDREKQVILEEIKGRDDSPEDFIFDQFLEDRCGRRGLGHSVLGYEDTIGNLSRNKLYSIYRKAYRPGKLILAIAGNLNGNSAERLVSKTVSKIKELHENGEGWNKSGSTAEFQRGVNVYSRKIEQTHFVVGVESVPFNHDDRYACALIEVLLSGGMSSRLFQEVREKLGLVYDIQSMNECFRDRGFFTISASTRPENLRLVLEVTAKELAKVRGGDVSEAELSRAKQQFRASIAMSFESVSSRMMKIGRSEIYYGRNPSDDEVMDMIQSVNLVDVQRVAGKLLRPGRFAASLLGPFGKKSSVNAAGLLLKKHLTTSNRN